MSCAEIRPRLGELLVGALEGEELESILAHVEACEDCGVELGELQRLEESLRVPAEVVPAGEQASEVSQPAARRIDWRLWIGPALAAAVLLMVVFLRGPGHGPRLVYGTLSRADTGQRIPYGEPLTVGEDATLAFEGSLIQASAGTRLELLGRRTARLLAGAVALRVEPNETPFVLHTPRGQARVLGTTFRVEVSEEKDMRTGAKASATITVVTLAVATGVVMFVPDSDDPSVRVEAGQSVVAGPDGVKLLDAESASAGAERVATLEKERDTLQAETLSLGESKTNLEIELAAARKQMQELESRLNELEAQVKNAPAPVKKLGVAYGKWAESELLKNANWKEMAGAMDEMLGMMPELYEKLAKGEALGPELTQRMGRENTKLLKFAIETMGKLPTNAKSTGNGPFTHPIVIANLVVEHLKLAKEPLSEAQLWELHGLGAKYDDEWERAAAGYTEGTYTLQKVLDELTLKQIFYEGMVALLTEPQRTIVVRPTIHHKAGLDVYSPVLMLTGVGHPTAGPSTEVLKQKLVEAAKAWGFDDANLQSADLVFDTWLSELGELTPHVGAEVNFYTLADAISALRAQLKAMHELETRLGPKESIRANLRNQSTFRVPRLSE